ncbi:MAG: hypothetical protein ABSF80_02620 [Chitinispirillaceae bacterium]|jgi:hypothetical protein
MKKSLAFLSVGVVIAVTVGCGLNPAGTVTVTIANIDTVVMGDSTSIRGVVQGTIESDSAITNVTMSIKNSAGTILAATIAKANFTHGYASRDTVYPNKDTVHITKDTVDLNNDMHTWIYASSSASAGTDTLIITVSSGRITKGASHPFTVIP